VRTLSGGLLTKMNALPLKNPVTPQAALDRLIADYGLRKVLLAFVARLVALPARPKARKIDVIPPYLRKDLGLPPEPPPRTMVDLAHLRKDRPW